MSQLCSQFIDWKPFIGVCFAFYCQVHAIRMITQKMNYKPLQKRTTKNYNSSEIDQHFYCNELSGKIAPQRDNASGNCKYRLNQAKKSFGQIEITHFQWRLISLSNIRHWKWHIFGENVPVHRHVVLLARSVEQWDQDDTRTIRVTVMASPTMQPQ